ncbi:MAG: hypothetical protein U0414_11650 [Polyangiaceae bacterium]
MPPTTEPKPQAKKQEISYTWTKVDADIYAAVMDGKAPPDETQGGWVTPYGIPSKCVLNPPDPGNPIALDLAWSYYGECWRANRFHVAGSWIPNDAARWTDWSWTPVDHPGIKDGKLGAYHAYEWIEWPIPGDVDTLGKLCAHLVKTDPVQFPKEIYLNTSKDPSLAPAMMLFDYWGHSAWRCAKMMEAGVQAAYNAGGGDITIAPAPGSKESFGWVLRRKTVLPPVPAAPAPPPPPRAPSTSVLGTITGNTGTKVQTPASLAEDVKKYVTRLRLSCGEIDGLFRLSDAVLRERMSQVHMGTAVKAIAEVSRDDNKYTQEPREIAALLDDVLPKARDYFLATPVSGQNRLVSTMNTRASLDAETTKLHDLLFTETYRDLVREWNRAMFGVYDSLASRITIDGVPMEGASVDKEYLTLDNMLQETLAGACETYGEAAYQLDDDPSKGWKTHGELRDIFDAAPESYATSVDDIDGPSPIAVTLTATGKHYSTGRKFSKVGLKLLQAVVSWGFFKEARDVFTLEKREAFAEEIFKRVPKWILDPEGGAATELRESMRTALIAKDRVAAAKVTDTVSKKLEPSAVKALFRVLDLASAVCSLFSTKEGSALVVGLSFAEDGTKVAEKALGTLESILERLKRFEGMAKKLATAGACFGVLSAAFGLTKGIVKFVETLYNGESTRAVIAASLELAGGMSAATGAVLVLVGSSTGGVVFALEALAAALALVAGAIAPKGTAKAPSGPQKTRIGPIMTELIETLRAKTAWSQFEKDNPDSEKAMARVLECCKGANGDLAPAHNDCANWSKLRAVGLDDDAIRGVLLMIDATRPTDAGPDWQ